MSMLPARSTIAADATQSVRVHQTIHTQFSTGVFNMHTAVICPDLQTFLGLRQISDVHFRSFKANSSMHQQNTESLTAEALANYDGNFYVKQGLHEWENYRNFPIMSVLPDFPVNKFLKGFLALVAAFSCVIVDLSPSYMLSIETVVLPRLPYFNAGGFGIAYPLIPQIEMILRESLKLRPAKCQRCLNEFLVTNLAAVKLPISGEDELDDGCPRSEIRSNCSHCLPILSDCGHERWVQVSRLTREPICVPRLCGEGMLYVEAAKTCYDVNDPHLCGMRNMRAFLTAYGDVVCQCREGFLQDRDGTCQRLYSQGSCSDGEVFAYSETANELTCFPRVCQNDDLPYLGGCHELGSSAPCNGEGFLGISYLTFTADCSNQGNVDVKNKTVEAAELSPEPDDSSEESNDGDSSELASHWNSIFHDVTGRRQPAESQFRIRKRQGAIFDTPILNPCLPGSKRGTNWKCYDGTLGVYRSRLTRETSRPNLFCPPNLFLTRTGHCVSSLPDKCACGFIRNERTFQCELKA